jgi:hypothetical protein
MHPLPSLSLTFFARIYSPLSAVLPLQVMAMEEIASEKAAKRQVVHARCMRARCMQRQAQLELRRARAFRVRAIRARQLAKETYEDAVSMQQQANVEHGDDCDSVRYGYVLDSLASDMFRTHLRTSRKKLALLQLLLPKEKKKGRKMRRPLQSFDL